MILLLLLFLFIFEALRGQAPQYLGQLCCYKQRPGHLRQPRDLALQVPLTQRSVTEAAKRWPADMRAARKDIHL